MFLNSRKCKLGNVVDVAIAAGNFKILLKILSELEVPTLRSMTLVDILKMQREVTVFAPSDEAFAKLPEGTLESLTDEQKLTIVSRHIAPGVSLLAADVITGPVKTFGNESIMLINKDAEGKIIQYNYYDGEEIGWFQISYEGNIISVVTPDVMASNGVIHVIDKVILPPLPPPTTTVAPPIVPGLNLCIPNLFGDDGPRNAEQIGQVSIVRCGPNEVCQKIGEGQLGQYG